jgi:hypothetical protein
MLYRLEQKPGLVPHQLHICSDGRFYVGKNLGPYRDDSEVDREKMELLA